MHGPSRTFREVSRRSFPNSRQRAMFLRWVSLSYMLLQSIAAIFASVLLYIVFHTATLHPTSQVELMSATFGNFLRATSMFSFSATRAPPLHFISKKRFYSHDRSSLTSDPIVGDTPQRWRAALEALPPVGSRLPSIFLAHGCKYKLLLPMDGRLAG